MRRPKWSAAAALEEDSCGLLNEARDYLASLKRGGMTEISKLTGITVTWLVKLRDGKFYDPGVRSIEKVLLHKRSMTAALPKRVTKKSAAKPLLGEFM